MGRKVVDRYSTVSAMMYVSLNVHVPLIDIPGRLESGALYCVGGIAFVIISAYELSSVSASFRCIDTNTVGDHAIS
jgi:hypothetical protein